MLYHTSRAKLNAVRFTIVREHNIIIDDWNINKCINLKSRKLLMFTRDVRFVCNYCSVQPKIYHQCYAAILINGVTSTSLSNNNTNQIV